MEFFLLQDGLERRGFKESGFLNEVAEVVRTGKLIIRQDAPLFFLFSGGIQCSHCKLITWQV